MEKKFYIIPAIDCVKCAVEKDLLTVSSDDLGIGYGGTDDGTLEAAVRELIDEISQSE